MNPEWLKGKKIAIVADWLTTYGGAEKVVKTVSDIFPEAPIFTSQYSKKRLNWFNDKDVRTGWMNIFPASLRKILSVFRGIYFSHLKLDDYDIIISISTAESKGIKTNENQLHISYLQGPPIQYFWGMYDDYVENPGFGKLNFIVRFFFKLLVKPLRNLDYKYAQRPDYLMANSTYSAEEIKKYYNRDAEVIFPPVEIEKFSLNKNKKNYFISTSRQVNWKRLDLAVEACLKTDSELILIGDGAEHNKLVKLAAGSDKIKFLPPTNDTKKLEQLISSAKGFIFTSLEPFGIAPIEALSAGTPVLAFKEGGALDYIKNDMNGMFFAEQSVDSLVDGIQRFNRQAFDYSEISKTAKQFSQANFVKDFQNLVEVKIDG